MLQGQNDDHFVSPQWNVTVGESDQVSIDASVYQTGTHELRLLVSTAGPIASAFTDTILPVQTISTANPVFVTTGSYTNVKWDHRLMMDKIFTYHFIQTIITRHQYSWIIL